MYTCSRCDGTGRVWFSSLMAGLCFQCCGTGKQKTKPAKKAIKWAIFGHDRMSGASARLYNVNAKTAEEALEKAYELYEKASTAWKDENTLVKAVAVSWEELEQMGKLDCLTLD